ncbi:MAG: hypothetical protein AAF960_11200 [Bacteroidota bacterium]
MSKTKEKTWVSPTKKFVKEMNEHIKQNGITKEDKDFLLDELDDMIEKLQNWKEENQSKPSA